MLQKVDNISWQFVRHKEKRLFHSEKLLDSGHMCVHIGKKIFNFPPVVGTLQLKALTLRIKQCDVLPYCFKCGGVSYWFFKHKFYKDTDGYTDGLKPNEVAALLITRDKLKRQHINRAMTIASLTTQSEKAQRSGIPDDVKLLVAL